ncbi:LuxR family transcriptional regulator [Mesorhizobium sp. M0518]|uniref:LuxR family transcriptional regulator n=1 Tax=Mesorhizobium sp. M0518 TaxID=2956956 RepID=UPI00333D1C99
MANQRTTAVPQVRTMARGEFQQFSLVPSDRLPAIVGDAVAVEFGRFIDQSESAIDFKQLFDILSAFALKLDFPWVGYCRLAYDQEIMEPAGDCPTIVLNYPDKWQERYVQMGFRRIDPIIKRSRRQACPFRWSEVYKDGKTTELERSILEEAATFGLRSGVSVPLHGPGGNFAVMSFVQPCCSETQNKTVTYLQSTALYYHLRVARFVELSGLDKVPNLSCREKECILWVAKGKSSWDIGAIIGISENTVNFHIKKVLKKLDTSSRTAAALRAASLGIIEL